MSEVWAQDIAHMHNFYGFHDIVVEFDMDTWWKLVKFRADFLKEELNELYEAIANRSPEDVVDALTDLNVVSIGTLDLLQVDAFKAWDEVHACNMKKQVGVKPTRPNPFGIPDLIKPEGWEGPSHEGNHGVFNT